MSIIDFEGEVTTGRIQQFCDTGLVAVEDLPTGEVDGHYFRYTEAVRPGSLRPDTTVFFRHTRNEDGIDCIALCDDSAELTPYHPTARGMAEQKRIA